MAKGNDTYRAYRAKWSGRPVSKPSVVAAASRGGARIYVSWNGATGVARWQVLTGTHHDALRRVATAPRRGFETAVPITAAGRYVAVRALDRAGRPLAASDPVRVSR